MDMETIASLVAFALLLVVWIGAPAGVAPETAMAPSAAPLKA